MHFVYTIERPDGLVKIGRSQNVNQRLGGLQTSSVEKFSIKSKVEYATLNEARIVEAFWHVYLSPLRIKGEWFKPEASLESCKKLDPEITWKWLFAKGYIRMRRTRKVRNPRTDKLVCIPLELYGNDWAFTGVLRACG